MKLYSKKQLDELHRHNAADLIHANANMNDNPHIASAAALVAIARSLSVIAVCHMAANTQFDEEQTSPKQPENKTEKRSFIGQKSVD